MVVEGVMRVVMEAYIMDIHYTLILAVEQEFHHKTAKTGIFHGGENVKIYYQLFRVNCLFIFRGCERCFAAPQ